MCVYVYMKIVIKMKKKMALKYFIFKIRKNRIELNFNEKYLNFPENMI